MLLFGCERFVPEVVRDCAGHRYIRFSDIIAGWGRQLGPKDGPAACTQQQWQPMRDLAYQRAGIAHIPAALLAPQRVTILVNSPDEPRGMPNIEQILPALRAQHPHVDFKLEPMKERDAMEQMRVLAATSVLVTNVGSRSFRLVYLPDGAHVILVGAPEVDIVGGDGVKRSHRGSFVEVDTCWSSLGYVRVLKYHVTNATAVALGVGRAWSDEKRARMGDVYEWMRLWDSSVNVTAEQLGGLLTVALDRLQAQAEGAHPYWPRRVD